MGDRDHHVLEGGQIDRAAVSPATRFALYVEDVSEWWRATFRWAVSGDGTRPSLLPPSPRRATRGYWRESQSTGGQ